MAEEFGGDALIDSTGGQEGGHGSSAILRRHLAPDVGAVRGIPERIPEATVSATAPWCRRTGTCSRR